jgi:hypothetical protein
LLTTILADAISLGLTKMAESCPERPTPNSLAASLAYPRRNLFDGAGRTGQHAGSGIPAEHWGDGTTSSSDGQNFRTGSKAERPATYHQPEIRQQPGRTFYTHISGQYAPFHTKVVNVGVRVRPTCSTACCTTNPTCGSRNASPTRRASPITSSH